MSRRALVTAALGCALLLDAGASRGAAEIASTFDADTDGWSGVTSATGSPAWPTSTSGLAVEFSASDGSPPGSIRLSDPNNHWTYFRAPSKFLGDMSAYVGGTLSFDSRAVVGGSTANEAEVVLMGAGLVLLHEALSTLPSAWTTLSVPLSEGNWRVADTFNGALANDAQIAAVLDNLQELWINAEYYFPVVETIALDNVRLAPIPEPSQMALLLAGAALVGVQYWRRRREARS